ncbi:MAG TPA: HAD family hydrolase [Mycobacteriales bacterium]|nr:HAD family hydrolase [Mycobacteriales bacterium]
MSQPNPARRSRQSERTTPTRHIVWDWNGTLLDDNHAVVAAVNAVCAAYGRAQVTLEEWRVIFFRPLDVCYERLLGRRLSTTDWARLDQIYHDAYAELVPTVRLAADAAAALTGWRAGGGTQSLLSMWFHDDLVALVSDLGLAGYFARVDGLRQATGVGSKAAHLGTHLDALGLDPAEVTLIGDVVDDATAAASVGAGCVLLSTGITTRAALAEAGVPVVDSITAALALAAPDPHLPRRSSETRQRVGLDRRDHQQRQR